MKRGIILGGVYPLKTKYDCFVCNKKLKKMKFCWRLLVVAKTVEVPFLDLGRLHTKRLHFCVNCMMRIFKEGLFIVMKDDFVSRKLLEDYLKDKPKC